MQRTRYAALRGGAPEWEADTTFRRDALAFHVTMRPNDDRGVARHPRQLRRAAQILHAQAGPGGLLAFRVADTHVHVLLVTDRASAGRTAQRMAVALKLGLQLGVPFEPARIRPIATARHLRHALHYVLRQEERHGTDLDPTHDGSSLPDLIGLRALDTAILPRVRTYLPRLEQAEVRRWVDLDEIERFSPDPVHLADAAAAALALPDLTGNTPVTYRARCAAAQVLALPSGEVALHLGIHVRSVRRLRRNVVAPALLRAVDLQLRLRTALAGRVRAW